MRRTILVAGILLALSGCGGGGGGEEPAAAPSLDPHTRNVKFAECLREHGLDVPDPEPGKGMTMKFGPGTDQQKVQQAMEACREWAPTGMNGGGAPDPKRDEQMRAYAQCMRDNGVASFPDPEGGMVRLDPSSGEDPDFETAQKACASLMQGPQ
ncbi:lipoprotein [Actinoplanes sp. NPDC024001]|uniref:lipoprotein n=1 Tax=Actinoplanes sp. NPDC024001 TaxID=3154598 RepID=UPI0033C3F1D4